MELSAILAAGFGREADATPDTTRNTLSTPTIKLSTCHIDPDPYKVQKLNAQPLRQINKRNIGNSHWDYLAKTKIPAKKFPAQKKRMQIFPKNGKLDAKEIHLLP